MCRVKVSRICFLHGVIGRTGDALESAMRVYVYDTLKLIHSMFLI